MRSLGLKQLIFPIVSISLWALGFAEMIWNLRTRSQSVEVTKFSRSRLVNGRYLYEADVLRLQLNLKEELNVEPGQYIYLRIRDFYFTEKIQTHPFLICWWEPYHIDENGTKCVLDNTEMKNLDPEKMMELNGEPDDEEPDDEAPTGKALSLTILIQPVNGLTRRLANKRTVAGISFDGPFGQRLQLECYDNVFLVAKGIGLAGVLSYAKQLLAWRSSPLHTHRVTTRKLDIFWQMEDIVQEQWAEPYLRHLQMLDAKKIHPNYYSASLLQIMCYPPLQSEVDPHLRPNVPALKMSALLIQDIKLSVGRGIVVGEFCQSRFRQAGLTPLQHAVYHLSPRTFENILAR